MQHRPKLLLIMNPKSGTMLAPKYLSDIIGKFSGAGYLTSVLMTARKGDAREFAAEYGGEMDVIVVSGGDGTLNSVIDGLIKGGHDTTLGYIPSGSTNDFANSLGLPKHIYDCVDTIIAGNSRPIDIGTFNGRHFSYIASFGAFTSTSYSIPQNIKNILGHTAYVLGGIKDILSIKSIHARVIADRGSDRETVCEGDYLFGAVCNSTSVAGILKLDKLGIDMNDDFMEVLLIKMPRDPIALNDIVVNMLDGTLHSDQIEFFPAKTVEFEMPEGTHWTLDGEYEEGDSICRVGILHSAVRIIC